MENFEDLSSDSSDEDYVPGKESSDDEVSEVEEKDGGRDESGEDEDGKAMSAKSKKRKLKRNDVKARKRKGGIKLEDDDEVNEADDHSNGISAETEDILKNEVCKDDGDEKEKERANSLWASFMKDVEIKPKSKMVKTDPPHTEDSSASKTNSSIVNPVAKKITVTNVYDFAGEEVRVTEEVDADSKAAKESVSQHPKADPHATSELGKSSASPATCAAQSSGLSGVLNKIGAKKKMSTLEKSRLDWMQFKHQEGIDEDLKVFNKGKHGYLEKQAFLQRADERQFEVERSLRLTNRSNR